MSIHSITVNTLCTSLIVIVMTYVKRYLSIYLGIVFIPLFTLKTLYDLSCYLNIAIQSQEAWSTIWRGLIAFYIFVSLIIYLFSYEKD